MIQLYTWATPNGRKVSIMLEEVELPYQVHPINIANGERVSINQVLELLKQITGRTEIQAEYKEPRTGDILHSLADIGRATQILGYNPRVGLKEGLRLTVDALS